MFTHLLKSFARIIVPIVFFGLVTTPAFADISVGSGGPSVSKGVYNATLPTLSSGQSAPVPLNASSLPLLAPVTLNVPAPLPVSPGGTTTTYVNGGTSTGIPVKNSPGYLVSLINNNSSAQVNALSCYNNTSAATGSLLWSGTLPANGVPIVVNIFATTGIFCQAPSGTNAGNGLTITSQ